MRKHLLIGLLGAAVSANAQNFILGQSVTASGTFGVMGPVGLGIGFTNLPLADLSTITDGTYLAEGTVWNTGTVWWDTSNPGSENNSLTIDFGGLYDINYVALQADNNDQYKIEVLLANNTWIHWATADYWGDAGMRTRSGSLSIQASKARLSALAGDSLYSISEFELRGTPVPEPASLGALALGLGALLRRKRGRA